MFFDITKNVKDHQGVLSDSSFLVFDWMGSAFYCFSLLGFLPRFFFSRNLYSTGRANYNYILTCKEFSIFSSGTRSSVFVSWFMHVFFPLGFRLGWVLPFQNLFHPFFYSPLHHSEILLGIYMLDNFCLRLCCNIRDLFYVRILGLLALNTRIETIAGPRRFIRHWKEKWICILPGSIQVRSILGDLAIKLVPLNGVQSGEIDMEWIV